MPPDWLVAWTEEVAMVVAIITGIVALMKGAPVLHYKAKLLKHESKRLSGGAG